MVRIGKKFLKPHRCPNRGAFVVLTRHFRSELCKKCHNRKHRQSVGHRKQQQKYTKGGYQKLHQEAIGKQPYCALCDSTKCLTCHHAVYVWSGEWRGKHLTVPCDRCHRLWERKVNKIRAMEFKDETR